MSGVLAVRSDSLGDVLVTGPAIRALAARYGPVTLLCGPHGRAAGDLLPGVRRLWTWTAPWIDADPPPVDADSVRALLARVRAGRFDRAVVFTSFHQSPLPMALLLRLAGVPHLAAISEDYPGSLLDVRVRPEDLPAGVPEPERALALAAACGAPLPPEDDGRLALRADHGSPRPGLEGPLPDIPERPVVLHPGTSAPARAWPVDRFRATAGMLRERAVPVVVTGSADEASLTARVAEGTGAVDLGGRADLATLAGVLAAARAVVVANTGPAHLAAAVGTPVVSLFAPTVPAASWAPYGVPRRVLGDQTAPCASSRARECPVPGHPCLTSVTPAQVVAALDELAPGPPAGASAGHPPPGRSTA